MSERLREIKERFERTTYGAWKVYETEDGTCIGTVEDHPQLKNPAQVVCMSYWVKEPVKRIYIKKEDADFIANSKVDISWLIQQAEQTLSFKRLHKSYLDRYVESVGETNVLKDENKRLREALAFYADPVSYETNVVDQWEPIVPVNKDSGDIARKALEDK